LASLVAFRSFVPYIMRKRRRGSCGGIGGGGGGCALVAVLRSCSCVPFQHLRKQERRTAARFSAFRFSLHRHGGGIIIGNRKNGGGVSCGIIIGKQPKTGTAETATANYLDFV
jgi:hypothetical protein